MSSTTRTITTAGELLAQSSQLGRCELVRGELIHLTPAGADHGELIVILTSIIQDHVKKHKLGKVYGVETGFVIGRNPDTVRAPDVAFVRTARTPRGKNPGFFQGPPDLAVEVLSPSDTMSEMLDKVRQWLDAGAQQVWVADPRGKTIAVYQPGGHADIHGLDERIAGGELLPGFELEVREAFEPTC